MKTFMVSLDPPETNRTFAESVDAEITLLTDPDGEAAQAYGVLAPGGKNAQRATFYIGRDGYIRYIDKKVSPSTHGTDLVQRLQNGFRKGSVPAGVSGN